MIKKTLWIMLLFFSVSPICFAEPPVYVDNLTDALALSESTKTDLFVLFGAKWCKHCERLKDDIRANESVLDNHIVCFIETDKNKDLAREYKVRSIPDYLILRDKVEIKRKVGYESLAKFKDWIKKEDR